MSTWPLPSQFTDGESLDAALLEARITDKLNELRTLIPDPQMLQLVRTTTRTCGNDIDQTIGGYDVGVVFSAGDQISYDGAGVITVAVSGFWRWSSTVIWDAVTGVPNHRRHLFVYKNGVEPGGRNGKTIIPWPSDGGTGWPATTQSAGGPIQLDSSDTLQLVARQSTGGSVDLTSMNFSLERIA